MKRPRITLSLPGHPVTAEMTDALRADVDYQIVGARYRQSSPGPAGTGPGSRLLYSIAARARRSGPGAIAYQRLRSALVVREAAPENLLHACSHLIHRSVPWIGDYENVNVLGFYSPRLLRSGLFVEHLRRTLSSPYCRAIRVWSDSARQSFSALFRDSRIDDKVRVVYPAMAVPPEADSTGARGDQPRLLFVARGFWVKGGALFLDALKLLRGKLDFRADFVCDLPPECRHYRADLAGIVDFYEPCFSRNELFTRFYRHADIFVMLGMADSFGLALVEATAFGLPIVAFRLNSGLSDLLRMTNNSIQLVPDHQIFGESGVHSQEPEELMRRVRAGRQTSLVGRIAAVLADLISDRDLRAELGSRGRTAIMEGSLSVTAMRRAMLDLYASVTN